MSEPSVRVAVAGVGGRMGAALLDALGRDPGELVLGAASECAGSPWVGRVLEGRAGMVRVRDSLAEVLDDFDVLVDFTRPEASVAHAALCAQAGKSMVVGTTGFDAGQRAAIEAASKRIGLVMAPNMSVGVVVCLRLLEQAARAFGDQADVEIIEAHHRYKVDAPSGTALRMGEVVAGARGRSLEECAVHGRVGHLGQRTPGSIGMHAVRAGDLVGEHSVWFVAEGERVEITHRATSRANFAAGALRAARWVHALGRPGRFGMEHVLGFE